MLSQNMKQRIAQTLKKSKTRLLAQLEDESAALERFIYALEHGEDVVTVEEPEETEPEPLYDLTPLSDTITLKLDN